MGDSDEDSPQLSSHALSALHEFYTEKHEKRAANAEADDEHCFGSVEEDWQLSQFWYSDESALHLAKEAIAAAGAGGRIACVCTPTIYQKLKDLNREDGSTCLLEYDKRFSIYGDDFVFYDYNYPLNLPKKLEKNSFDIVLADPPYLSEECLGKTAETIKYLTKEKILLCTGAVMEDTAAKLLGVEMCQYIPKHTRHLANEFRCYANYDCGLDSNC